MTPASLIAENNGNDSSDASLRLAISRLSASSHSGSKFDPLIGKMQNVATGTAVEFGRRDVDHGTVPFVTVLYHIPHCVLPFAYCAAG